MEQFDTLIQTKHKNKVSNAQSKSYFGLNYDFD